MKRWIIAGALILGVSPVFAQQAALPFKPSATGARGTPLSVTTSDSSGTLPSGPSVVVSNAGTTNPMYCNVNGVAATTSDQPILAGSFFNFGIPTGVTTLHCIATGGTTTANMVGGIGTATGAGGGSGSGGGGGGAVTIANGADVVLGDNTDAASCTSGTSLLACIRLVNTNIQAGAGATGSAVPASAIYPGWRGQNAEQTAVTNGQLVGAAADLTGKLINLPYANPENFLVGQVTSAMTGTSSTALTGMGAQTGSFRVYATQCTFSNSHATQGTMILLQDGSGGTTLWQAPAAPAFGGAVVVFPTPIKTTANTGLFAANVTTGSNTFVSCTGYKGI